MLLQKNLVDTNIAAVIISCTKVKVDLISPKKYLKGLRAFCDEYGIALIFDEVTVWVLSYRKMVTYEHYDVIPDLST
jgi:glutamate-1-semialdehyde aminotransferase